MCMFVVRVCLQVLVGMLQISSFMNFATPTVSNLIDLDLMLNSQSVTLTLSTYWFEGRGYLSIALPDLMSLNVYTVI